LEVFKTIEKLYKKGKAKFVLWNHDLFFVLWILFSEKYGWIYLKNFVWTECLRYKNLWKEALELLDFNWGDKTFDSFLEKKQTFWNLSPLTNEAQIKRLTYFAKFLFENWDIFIKDDIWNILIHWGIPIYKSWKLVSIPIHEKFYSWIELLKILQKKFKEKDFQVLEFLLHWETENITQDYLLWLENRIFWESIDFRKENREKESSVLLCPTWIDNSSYILIDNDTNEISKKWESLKELLIKNNLKRLICGHWRNLNVSSKDFNNRKSSYWQEYIWKHLLRIDRSYNFEHLNWLFWNFWYTIIDKENQIIETGDSLYFLQHNK
jgi:hypothetical protein